MANNVCARLGSAQPFYTLALSLNRVLQGKVPVFTYPICFDASPPTIALSDVRSVQTTSTQDGAADRLTRFNTTLLLEVSDDNGATEDGSYCAEQAQFTLYCTGCGESFEPIVDIGTGAHTFVLADLSAGVHDITLHVEDSALNQSPPLEVRWVAGSAYAAVGLRSNVVSPDDGTVTLLSVHGLNQLPACSNATCTPGKSRGATSVTVQRDQNDAKAEAEAEACVTHSNIGHVKLFEVTVGDELLQDIAGLVDVSLLPLEITLGPTLVEFGYLDVAINNACSLHLQHSTGITSVALRVLVLESPFDKSSALDSCCGNGVSTPPACPMCVPSADNSSLKFTPLTKAQLQHPSTLVEATGSACQRVVECLHANVEQQPVTATSQWATFNSGDSAAPFSADAHDQQSDASAGTRGLPDQALGFILKQPTLSVSAPQSTSPHMVAPPSPAISNRSGIVHRPVALTPASSSPSHLSVSLTSPAPNTPPTPKLVQPAKVQAANTAASQHVPSDDYTSSSESESDGDVEFL
eukprot:m.320896 g.320896  ORF g.320896 m.320896 type:complete len:524 (+) comp15994_c0_seq36:5111-6682(+)